MGTYSIAVVAGDGIGPEVTQWAAAALRKVGAEAGHVFQFAELLAGGRAIDETGEPLPAATLEAARKSDAVLLGAVGGPKWDNLPGGKRPEQALLGLRAGLGVYANLRPARLLPQLRSACPLKESVLAASSVRGEPSFDMLIVRELTGGIYFGESGRTGDAAWDTETYSRSEIERLLAVAYDAAEKRKASRVGAGKVTVVDKANILESSRLWRSVAAEVAAQHPAITTDYLYVDNAAMQLVRAPGRFDVIATSNMFGDILSDEASVLTGSIGLLASASIGAPLPGSRYPAGLYEPIHGSAPDIAGADKANPLAAILSAALLLRYSFALEAEALMIENAVAAVLDDGWRTSDIAGTETERNRVVGCHKMGELVVAALGR